MGNPAGVRRDFDKLEQRRLEAAELLRQGIHQAEVARRVGVHRQSVSRWPRNSSKVANQLCAMLDVPAGGHACIPKTYDGSRRR